MCLLPNYVSCLDFGGRWNEAEPLECGAPLRSKGLEPCLTDSVLFAIFCQLFQLPCHSSMLCIEGSRLISQTPPFGLFEPPFWRSNFVFVFVSVLVPFWAPKRAPKVCQNASKTCTISILFSDLCFRFLVANFWQPPRIADLLKYVVFPTFFHHFCVPTCRPYLRLRLVVVSRIGSILGPQKVPKGVPN